MALSKSGLLCQRVGQSLLARTIKQSETEQFRQAVYHELADETKPLLSGAPHATQFGSPTKQQESTMTPSLSLAPTQ